MSNTARTITTWIPVLSRGGRKETVIPCEIQTPPVYLITQRRSATGVEQTKTFPFQNIRGLISYKKFTGINSLFKRYPVPAPESTKKGINYMMLYFIPHS